MIFSNTNTSKGQAPGYNQNKAKMPYNQNKPMLKIRPIDPFQIYISEVQDGSVNNAEQAKKILTEYDCKNTLVYFHHQHQAHRFLLESKNQEHKIQADAVIVNKQKVCLAMSVADCFPILVTHPRKKVFALIHAGWKPLLQNIIELTISDLVRLYGIDPGELVIWIGPGIRECCYISKTKPIQAELPSWQDAIKKRKNHWQVNLPAFIKNELVRLEVNKQNIFEFGVCTYCNPDNYFSHYRSTKKKEKDGRILIAVESLK